MVSPGFLMNEMKQSFWRFRMSLRETLVAFVVGALAIVVFLGVVHVMSPNSSPGTVAPEASATAPAAESDPAAYEEDPESPS